MCTNRVGDDVVQIVYEVVCVIGLVTMLVTLVYK